MAVEGKIGFNFNLLNASYSSHISRTIEIGQFQIIFCFAFVEEQKTCCAFQNSKAVIFSCLEQISGIWLILAAMERSYFIHGKINFGHLFGYGKCPRYRHLSDDDDKLNFSPNKAPSKKRNC